MRTLEEDLRRVINNHSVESASNTPDYILAELITNTLDTFAEAVRKRDAWHEVVGGDKLF